MIIKHWRTDDGIHEIQVEKVYGAGIGMYCRVSTITSGVVNSNSIRNTEHAALGRADDLVKHAECVHGINYKCTFTQGEADGV